jgi:plastocyanin
MTALRPPRTFALLLALVGVLAATAQASLAAPQHVIRKAVVVEVTAGKPTEFQFALAPKSVKRGAVQFKVVNRGKFAHGFTIDGHSTKVLKPRQATTITVLFKRPGRYVYQCLITSPPPDFGPGYNDTPDECGGGVFTVR